MQRAAVAVFAVFTITPIGYSAPKPPNPRAEEAIAVCKQAVISQAVNPESIDFDKTAWNPKTYGSGAGITVHLFNVRGSNSYGAIIRNDWECRMRCDKAKDGTDKPCATQKVENQSPMLPEVLKAKPEAEAGNK